jgi:hypothetical protein
METLSSSISAASPEFQSNAEHQRSLAANSHEKLGQVRKGGGRKQRQRLILL